LRELEAIRQAFAAAAVSVWFLNEERDTSRVGALPLLVKDLLVDPSVFADAVLPLPKDKKASVIRNFLLLVLRGVLNESYRAIVIYAQKKKIKEQMQHHTDWFPFLRAVRDSLNHSSPTKAVWKVGRYGKGWSCTWRGKRLDSSVDNKDMSLIFSPEDAIRLLADAEDFIKKL